MGNGGMRCNARVMKIRMSWARKVAVVAGMLAATGEGSLAGDFIRIREDDEVARLQTAYFGYEKDGVRVDLIGAIHIADKRYYEFLNQSFGDYESLLFEMVGGERLGGGEKKPDPEPEPAENKLAALLTVYETMEKSLGLSGQGAVIDYTAENFVHADLTMKEFEALQEERGESLLGFMVQAAISAERPSREPNSINLMRGMLGGKPDLVKLELMHTMADADKQIDSIDGANVIIGDRNARCIEVLDREMAGGKKNIGIFYGAAHFPDLERRLLEKGFARVSTKWATAWRVSKP
ncbi:MAG: hypothetical protein RLZZ505_6 [Verrucomicrobiota bacterium]